MGSLVKGTRVRLSEKAQHPEFRGLTGAVEKFVKSRKVYVIRLDDGRRYDAYPENVIKETDPTAQI